MKLIWNWEDVKDLMQEIVMCVYRYCEKFMVGINFKSWCFIIMCNIFINQYCKKKLCCNVNELIESFLFVVENKNVIFNCGEMNICMKEYKIIFGDIGKIYSVLFLMFYKGYEYKEIVSYLEILIGMVKSWIFLVWKKFRDLIKECYGVCLDYNG